MELLITGARGFIGGHLSKYFAERGFELTVVSRGHSQVLEKNVGNGNVVYKDIFDKSLFDIKISAKTCIHLATANDIVSRNPEEGIRLSAFGTKQALDYCLANGILNFIFFSTFQVYGTELTGIIDENTALRPENDYGMNHLFGERYVEMYSRKYGMNCTVVRPSNIYGKPFSDDVNRWTLVPLCFCKEAFNHGSITLTSSGNQMRNFVSLDTIAKSCEALLQQEGSRFNIVNVASSLNLSIGNVAQLVKVVYENRYNKRLDIRIKSQSPIKANTFAVDLLKLNSYGVFPEDYQDKMIEEIEAIFDLLEK